MPCYSAPVGVRCIVINVINPSVCASVCLSVREHISEPPDRSARNCVCRSPVAVAWSSSGGDVTFGRSGPYGVAWRAWTATSHQLGARPGWSLMSMNVLFIGLGPDLRDNGSQPSLNGSPRNLHTRFVCGRGWKPTPENFSSRPLKFGGVNLKFLRTAVNRERITSKRLNMWTNE